jgi:SAM-dependent methyltransferase
MATALDCPGCGGGAWLPLFSPRGFTYVVCPSCGTGRLDPLPSASAAALHYEESYFTDPSTGGYADYVGEEPLHRRNARARLARIAKACPGAASAVDVGCATGVFLDEARMAGYRHVEGVEVSDHARRLAAGRGLAVVEDLDAVAGPVDLVSFFQVLEHMVAPGEALRQAARIVRPGGAVVIETWDRGSWIARAMGRRWQQVTPPTVIWLFTKPGLRGALEAAGFGDVSIRATSKAITPAMALGQVGGKMGRMGRPVMSAARSRPARVAIPYYLGDLITVTARR